MSYQRRWKRRWWAPVTAATAAGIVLLAGCASGGSTSAGAAISPASGHGLAGFAGTASPTLLPTAMPSSMPGMPSPAPAGQGAAAPVASNAVTIHNFAFGPQAVTVKVGTTVHWVNHDTEAHTVTSNTGAFGSPVLQPGHGYSYTFTKPGSYSYHCTIHPFMTGKVVVS
ncbi:MAG TPA: cupredoxin family copper-binding protein [Streptosporangiaceae bacterium]|nr:cupredoxin family copper-binding protein [Streptosporangiaceae bacterium]